MSITSYNDVPEDSVAALQTWSKVVVGASAAALLAGVGELLNELNEMIQKWLYWLSLGVSYAAVAIGFVFLYWVNAELMGAHPPVRVGAGQALFILGATSICFALHSGRRARAIDRERL